MNWEEFISLKNIYKAWVDFSGNKKNKSDVINFKMNLEDEILSIRHDLAAGTYKHGPYTTFTVYDPKKRVIHKAMVRDRVVHRLLYNYLLSIFNGHWLDCSFACRPGFGQHLSINKVKRAIGKVTRNYSRECLCVKCDIKKFFDNIDHNILYKLICRKIYEPNTRQLVGEIINSFKCNLDPVGIPIGNLTSQIFANIYLHEIDQFITKTFGLQYYIRYADDVVIIARSKIFLESIISIIQNFLENRLQLNLHPKKIVLRKWHQGIDFLGYVIFPYYTILRTKTKRRMFKRANKKNFSSYSGILQHCRSQKLQTKLLEVVKKSDYRTI